MVRNKLDEHNDTTKNKTWLGVMDGCMKWNPKKVPEGRNVCQETACSKDVDYPHHMFKLGKTLYVLKQDLRYLFSSEWNNTSMHYWVFYLLMAYRLNIMFMYGRQFWFDCMCNYVGYFVYWESTWVMTHFLRSCKISWSTDVRSKLYIFSHYMPYI